MADIQTYLDYIQSKVYSGLDPLFFAYLTQFFHKQFITTSP